MRNVPVWIDEARLRKLKGAAWNYLQEHKDYPDYKIKDGLARAEAYSIRAKTGRRDDRWSAWQEGCCLPRFDRDIHRLLPVCAHLGCVVSWNPVESRRIAVVTDHVSNLLVNNRSGRRTAASRLICVRHSPNERLGLLSK